MSSVELLSPGVRRPLLSYHSIEAAVTETPVASVASRRSAILWAALLLQGSTAFPVNALSYLLPLAMRSA